MRVRSLVSHPELTVRLLITGLFPVKKTWRTLQEARGGAEGDERASGGKSEGSVRPAAKDSLKDRSVIDDVGARRRAGGAARAL